MCRRLAARAAVAGLVLAGVVFPVRSPADSTEHPALVLFFQAASADSKTSTAALKEIEAQWRDGYAAMFIDVARLVQPPRDSGARLSMAEDDPDFAVGSSRLGGRGLDAMGTSPRPRVSPAQQIRKRLLDFIKKRTGQKKLGKDLDAWRRWLWSQPYDPHPEYAIFKGALLKRIDERMAAFFASDTPPLVRLDEVEWGGVQVDGIPPLDHPPVIAASAATYLEPDDVVFGVSIGGETRAYPKRILAWHELARDSLAGAEVAIVYCTLCGTVIPYAAEADGQPWTFGTSGLLYRSNKLLFDEESMSLWSSLTGKPVIGPLAGSGVELEAYPVVTTAWQEWRSLHPDTTVLSLDTGFERDYSEGAAYRDYFASDALMFPVPSSDDRLKNKDEVLGVLVRDGSRRRALALDASFLEAHPVHQVDFAGTSLAVLTSPGGANRVYDAGETRFAGLADGGGVVVDALGARWRILEDELLPEADDQFPKPRLAARRAFWFGWHAQFPATELVK
jgi:hypothetical protein